VDELDVGVRASILDALEAFGDPRRAAILVEAEAANVRTRARSRSIAGLLELARESGRPQFILRPEHFGD
jgi:hypothetical protein